jgi:hypothetical protein
VNHHVLAAVLSLLEPAAHKQAIVGAGLHAKTAKHTTLNLDVEDFQTVLIPLFGGGLTGAGNDLDNSQRAVFSARSTAGAALFVPDELLTPESGILLHPLLRVLNGKRLLGHVLQSDQQALGHGQTIHTISPLL